MVDSDTFSGFGYSFLAPLVFSSKNWISQEMENPFEIHMQNAEDHILLGFLWFHIWQNPRSNFWEKSHYLANHYVDYKYRFTKILTWLINNRNIKLSLHLPSANHSNSFWHHKVDILPNMVPFFHSKPFAILDLQKGWRTFQPRTFQPRASTPDFSTREWTIMKSS